MRCEKPARFRRSAAVFPTMTREARERPRRTTPRLRIWWTAMLHLAPHAADGAPGGAWRLVCCSALDRRLRTGGRSRDRPGHRYGGTRPRAGNARAHADAGSPAADRRPRSCMSIRISNGRSRRRWRSRSSRSSVIVRASLQSATASGGNRAQRLRALRPPTARCRSCASRSTNTSRGSGRRRWSWWCAAPIHS